ncbi:MAG: D-alanyl-D-alanine carboxypeptidase/D-alanyl-D-alanine-endopeptidase [Nitrospinae bacterium]|nr:D-alanyl-D-alanine carboxypeptidase/D-alanyl-D-alanine-endopeptidase [Nitrospinota bacterium]
MTKKRLLIIIFTIISFILIPLLLRAEVGPATIFNRVDNVVKRGEKRCLSNGGSIGVKVYSLDHKEPIYSHNGDTLLIPASNMKLITTAAALKVLHPDYRFKTSIFYDGKRTNSHIEGNLYLKGYGDPKLVLEEMWLLAHEIKNSGVKEIRGNIVADDSFFDKERYGHGWGKDLDSNPYNAKIGALSFNFNTVRVYVRPGDKVGDKPYVALDPQTDAVDLVNMGKTVGAKDRGYLNVYSDNGGSKDRVVVKGELRINSEPKYYYRTISNPPLFAAKTFRSFLEKEGILVTGNITIGETPSTAKELLQKESKSLSVIIRDLNKMSNNFVAEQILKTMGAEVIAPPGTTAKGIKVVEDFLEKLGIKRGEYKMVDGSGLSKENRLTPAQIIKVLVYTDNDFTIKSDFISSLSVMGTDGTLKDRSIRNGKNRSVRAKTGTLDNVSSLSGYLKTAGGENLAFSIMVNGFRCSVDDVWELQNEIVDTLIEGK